eukprot:gene1030-biopygen10743
MSGSGSGMVRVREKRQQVRTGSGMVVRGWFGESSSGILMRLPAAGAKAPRPRSTPLLRWRLRAEKRGAAGAAIAEWNRGYIKKKRRRRWRWRAHTDGRGTHHASTALGNLVDPAPHRIAGSFLHCCFSRPLVGPFVSVTREPRRATRAAPPPSGGPGAPARRPLRPRRPPLRRPPCGAACGGPGLLRSVPGAPRCMARRRRVPLPSRTCARGTPAPQSPPGSTAAGRR